jgi:hypothetical protein
LCQYQISSAPYKMGSFLFKQVDDCSTCGDCMNEQFPDFFASVVGVARVGGVPPIPVWLQDFAGGSVTQKMARPSGTNNGVYRTLEITSTLDFGGGSSVTMYQKFVWHPVMGDLYWTTESVTSIPAQMTDYYYEWKLEDATVSGVPQVTITDPNGTGRTNRATMGEIGFFDPNVVVDTYGWDILTLHDDRFPLTTATWQLSDPVTMQDGFTGSGASGEIFGARVVCDQIDILSDNVSIATDPAVSDPASPYTSNLTDSFASPRSAQVVRVAARRDGGVEFVTLASGVSIVNRLGAYVVHCAEAGFGFTTSCNIANEVDGHNTDFYFVSTIACFASKMKFAFRTPEWCFKTWQMQTTPITFVTDENLQCQPVEGTKYNTEDLRWVVYPWIVDEQEAEGDVCGNPEDIVQSAVLVDCVSYGSGDGNTLGSVGDLPQPCTSGVDICNGDVWYYDYSMIPFLGWLGGDGSNCGVNCDCGTTERNILQGPWFPPEFDPE